MYRNRTILSLSAVWLLAATSLTVQAGPADDQYTVAAGHYRSGRWDLAAEEFQTFLAKYPGDDRAATVRFLRGETLVQLGRYQEALRHFSELLQENPEHPFARQARFRRGEIAYLDGDDAEARKQLRSFHEQYPEDALNAYALAYLGDIQLRGGDARAAERTYGEALRKYPDSSLADECRFGLGRAWRQLGDAASAERFFRYLAGRTEGALADDALLQLAELEYDRRQYAAAADLLQQLISLDDQGPLLPRARYWLAKCRIQQGDWSEAVSLLRAAIEGQADAELASAIVFELATCLRKTGDLAAARQEYERLGNRWPDSRWAADALEARIAIAFEAGNLAAVDMLAEQFARDFPDHPLALRVRQVHGRALLKHGSFERAGAAFEALRDTLARSADGLADPQPRDHSDTSAPPRIDSGGSAPAMAAAERQRLRRTTVYYLALSRLATRRYDQCLQALEELTAEDLPPELTHGVLAARGSALIGLEQYEEAIEPLRACLETNPQGPDSEKCRAQLIVALAERRRLDEADEVYGGLSEADEHRALLLQTTLYLADANARQGRGTRAAELYRRLADKRNPQDYIAKGLSGLARIETAPGDNGAAFDSGTSFGELLDEFAATPEAARAALARAANLENQQRVEEALAAYQLVYDRLPESPEAPRARLAAAQLWQAQKKWDACERLLRETAGRYPDFERADAVHYLWAWTLVDLGRGEEADDVFRRLADQYPQSTYWADATYRLAERAAKRGDFDRAAELTDRLLQTEIEPQVRMHALYLDGQVAAARGAWDRVEHSMGTLVRDNPDADLVVPAEYWRAEAAYRSAKYDVAAQRYRSLAERTEGREEEWLAMIPLRQAQILARETRWTEAQALAESIPRRFPDFRQQYEVDYLIGRCLSSRGQLTDARQAYQRVVRSPAGGRTETAAMAQWMIGETYFLQKNYSEAVKAYHRVDTLYAFPRWQAVALLQAGKCHEMQGQWAEAVALYAQLLKDYPRTRYVEEASRRLRKAKQQASNVTSG